MTTPAAPAKTTAPPAAGGTTDTHWASQLALIGLILADLQTSYRLIAAAQPAHMPAFIDEVTALVHHYGSVSGLLAADFYDQTRHDAGVRGSFTATPVKLPDQVQVDAAIRWATADLWQPDPNLDAIHVKVEGVADKLVLDVGRDTITDSVADDPKATGFARSGRPNCCAFCAMLISRGAVYKSARSATIAEFGPRAGKSYHDHCHCKVSPFWDPAHVPTAQETELGALWRDEVAAKGYQGPDALNAFRRVLGRN